MTSPLGSKFRSSWQEPTPKKVRPKMEIPTRDVIVVKKVIDEVFKFKNDKLNFEKDPLTKEEILHPTYKTCTRTFSLINADSDVEIKDGINEVTSLTDGRLIISKSAFEKLQKHAEKLRKKEFDK